MSEIGSGRAAQELIRPLSDVHICTCNFCSLSHRSQIMVSWRVMVVASMLVLSQLALEVKAQSPSPPDGPVGKSVQENA